MQSAAGFSSPNGTLPCSFRKRQERFPGLHAALSDHVCHTHHLSNKELNIATSHAPYVEALLDRVFTPDFGKSVELTEPFPVRWSDHLMEIVADYLL